MSRKFVKHPPRYLGQSSTSTRKTYLRTAMIETKLEQLENCICVEKIMERMHRSARSHFQRSTIRNLAISGQLSSVRLAKRRMILRHKNRIHLARSECNNTLIVIDQQLRSFFFPKRRNASVTQNIPSFQMKKVGIIIILVTTALYPAQWSVTNFLSLRSCNQLQQTFIH